MRNAKHITTACLRCRRRKVKCDGQPTCLNCSISNQECLYLVNSDKRRTSNKVTTSLRQRLSQLEDTLRAHDIELPPPSPTYLSRSIPSSASNLEQNNNLSSQRRGSVVGEVPATDPRRSSRGMSPTFETSQQSPSRRSPETKQPDPASQQMFLADDESDSECDDERPPTPPHNNPRNAQNPQQRGQVPLQRGRRVSLETPCDAHPGADDDMASSLTARMGSLQIAEDGQLRYYGPTSNLHISRNGLQGISRSSIRHVASEGKAVLGRAGLDHPVLPSVEIHLAKLYFAWEDPAIHVVDEDIYFEARRAWLDGNTTPYYSETLNNAICAIGACLASGESLGVPEPAPEFFSLRGKALLDIEMDSPTVATVQALVVMSALEAAFTRDARGWLYSGMALRLSVDLGLHLDLADHCRSGMLSPRDVEARRTTFWGVFIHDSMWSVYVGRPWAAGVQYISTPRPPRDLDKVRMQTWNRYPAADSQSVPSGEGVFNPLESCTDATISLCELMRKVNRTLYSGQRMDIKALVTFLTKMKNEFKGWLDNLHAELEVDPYSTTNTYTPGVLQLHMQYNAALVAFLRPYLPRDNQPWHNSLTSAEDTAVLNTVEADCVAAAHRMTDILRCYRRQHTLRYTNIQIVHIIFTCCLVHIYNGCNRASPPQDESSRTSLDDLQFCCQALGEIGRCYGNATRALEVIILFKGEWQRRAAPRRSGARVVHGKSPAESNNSGLARMGHDESRQTGRFSTGAEEGRRAASASDPAVLMNAPELTDFLFPPPLTDFLFQDANNMGLGLGLGPTPPQVGGYGWDPCDEWQNLNWTGSG
ncbi:fungal-specific transcription factor domain-containing protein, partial [Phialemonium atrogriseum]